METVSAFSVYKKKPKTKIKPKAKGKIEKPIKPPQERFTVVNNIVNCNQKYEKKKLTLINKKKVKKGKSKQLKYNKIENSSVSSNDKEPDQESLDTVSSEAPLLVSNSNLPIFTNGNHNASPVDSDFSNSGSSNANLKEFEPVYTDSESEALKAFKWMIAPYVPKEFFVHNWERKPLHITRNKPKYYQSLISTPKIDAMLRTENIQFTKNIDITSYVDEKRETHNPVGRAYPHVVWDYYLNGCSIRLLNPQTYIPKLHLLNATLQEFFNCFVGSNCYLTPPDSQGFAPHYDDIEAFILQVEGKKHWKIYKPLSEKETLPRVSSKNFDQDEIGDPIMELTLLPGDMLYFPRGFIHQGVTIEGEHSLHITVSMYQKHSWADLFEKMIPIALQAAINENIDLRKGLPFDIYDNFGLVNSDINTPRKAELTNFIKCLCDKIKDHLPIDQSVDEISKDYQHAALPPVLTDMEKDVTVHGDSDVMIENGKVINRVEIDLDTRIRLVRKNILRMVMEDETIRIYYCVENSLEYHGTELQYLEIDENLAPAIETLIMSYPSYVYVENLDVPKESDKLQVANDLWEKGLIMTEYPLSNLEDD